MTPITSEEIDAAKSTAGGFTRNTLAQWGVPWPPPSGWRTCIEAHGYPYQHELNTYGKAKPQEAEADQETDPADLLRKVVVAVINHGQAHILWDLPEVLDFFGARIPERDEVAHLHNVDERIFGSPISENAQ